VEKYFTAAQAKDDDITRRMRIVCWILKSTVTYSEYVIVIVFFTAKEVAQTCVNFMSYIYFSLVLKS